MAEKPASPETAAQAERMKARLGEPPAQRRQNDALVRSSRDYSGGNVPAGVDPTQTRSGRRGNR